MDFFIVVFFFFLYKAITDMVTLIILSSTWGYSFIHKYRPKKEGGGGKRSPYKQSILKLLAIDISTSKYQLSAFYQASRTIQSL